MTRRAKATELLTIGLVAAGFGGCGEEGPTVTQADQLPKVGLFFENISGKELHLQPGSFGNGEYGGRLGIGRSALATCIKYYQDSGNEAIRVTAATVPGRLSTGYMRLHDPFTGRANTDISAGGLAQLPDCETDE